MKKIIFIIALVFFSMGCSRSWLDIKPKGKLMITDTKELDLLLNNTNFDGFLKTYSRPLYSSDDYVIPDQNITWTQSQDLKKYYWNKQLYSSEEDDIDWTNLYFQISRANTIIFSAKTVKGSQADKDRYHAEAVIQRAFAYFILVNEYGKQYDKTKSNDSRAVPLLLTPDLVPDLTRATVGEIYSTMVSELNNLNIKELPDISSFRLRASKSSYYALLSRYYLFMGNYSKALETANRSLSIYHELYNYSALPHKTALNKELLDFDKAMENKESLMVKTSNFVSAFKTPYPSDGLLALYDKKNDFRYLGFYKADENLKTKRVKYMQSSFDRVITVKLGLSVPEEMLIKAECLVRTGKFQDGISVINELRKNRFKGGSAYEVNAGNKKQALKLVKIERRIELAFKGMRWFDIKRYNVVDHDDISINHSSKTENHILKPGDLRWTFGIGLMYSNKNPELLK